MNVFDRFDFRYVTWGMSQHEVIASEESKPRTVMPAVVMYDCEWYGLPMTLSYYFAPKLADAICVAAILQSSPPDTTFYASLDPRAHLGTKKPVQDYEHLLEQMTAQLGPPFVQDDRSADEELIRALKNAPEKLDENVRRVLGDIDLPKHSEEEMRSMSRHSTWNTPKTNITLALAPGIVGGAMLMIKYVSRKHAHMVPSRA